MTWANANYLSIVESQSENTADVQWPLPRVFHDQMQKPPAKGQIQRVSIVPKNRLGAPKRFEVSAIPMDGDMLFLANPADRLMQAEEALTRHPGLMIEANALRLGGISPDWITDEGGLRLRPDYWADTGGMDGFYMAVQRKPA